MKRVQPLCSRVIHFGQIVQVILFKNRANFYFVCIVFFDFFNEKVDKKVPLVAFKQLFYCLYTMVGIF
jgi:hypothetical protein